LALPVQHSPSVQPKLLTLLFCRWISLIVVMTGVGLVGFSGSLVKDVVKESVVLSRMFSSFISDLPELPPPEGTDQPEATKVVIGEFCLRVRRLN
jgi:hypothetical protein